MTAAVTGLLDTLRGLTVLVIGDAMLDVYLAGSTDRLCREAPVPIVALAQCTRAPGGAANVAANAAALGARVHFLSVVGTDPEAAHLRDALSAAGVAPTDVLGCPGRATLTKQRVIADGHMLVRFDQGSTHAMDEGNEDTALERLTRAHAAADAIVVSDYAYGVLTPRVIAHLARLQARSPRTLLVDAKDLPAYQRVGVTVAKPSFAEAARLIGLDPAHGAAFPEARPRAVVERGARLLDVTGARMAAVTLDAEGALIVDRDGPPYRTRARAVSHARAAGAGDTFGVALALMLAAGADIPTAADIASAAAGVVVAKDGTAVCTAAELARSLVANPKRLADGASLAACVESHRRRGHRVVFTNGCFDILHRGHIAYLHQARALGDVLIVGVNSDAGVRRLKGVDRPINPLSDRLEVLAAMSAIDHLVAFDDDTPQGLIQIIRPDVFVKGGDYRRDQLPEAPLVERLGGEVRLLPYVHDRSTSELITRIRQHAGALA